MFVDIPLDKVRPGLVQLNDFIKNVIPLHRNDIKAVGLLEDDEMVGFVIYNSTRIFSLAVPKKHRGAGYGRTLLEYVLNTETPKDLVAYISPSSKSVVGTFVNWGFIFEGFFKTMESDSKYYRLVYRPPTVEEIESNKEAWLHEDCCNLADEMLVAYTVM